MAVGDAASQTASRVDAVNDGAHELSMDREDLPERGEPGMAGIEDGRALRTATVYGSAASTWSAERCLTVSTFNGLASQFKYARLSPGGPVPATLPHLRRDRARPSHILNGGWVEHCASGRYRWFLLLDTRLFPAGAFGGVAPCLRLALAKVSMRRRPRRLAPLHRAASIASHCQPCTGVTVRSRVHVDLLHILLFHGVRCAGDNKSAGRQCAT